MATEVLWWIFAIFMVVTALGVVGARSVIHSAIFLILSLAGTAVMYVFLTIEFLALVQLLIYGGAVAVLVLLALMLTRQAAGGERISLNGPQAPFAALVGLVLATVLVGVAIGTTWPGAADQPGTITIERISEVLFEDFGATFILVSVLLLVAVVGAIILARQEDAE
ncbi:MAG: NADH-quinone oxidoreductase subunit J [Dehalococcoidia bacterium]|nr:NADH-quinone oxidoreductase subunit J [Dehalococcoidia bacterium]